MYVINRIDVTSAFKVGAVLSALIWAVLGVFMLLLQTTFFSMIVIPLDGANYDMSNFNGFATASFSVLCMLYFCGVITNAVIGGVMAALSAFLYNIVARWTGGLKMEIAREQLTFEKFKISPDDDPFDTFG